MLALIEE